MNSSSVSQVTAGVSDESKTDGLAWKLFLASFAALYCELVIIRYLSTEIRIFAYLKNLPLIASFFGIGLGMIMGAPRKSLKLAFPIVAFILFALMVFARALHITHIPLPGAEYYVWGLPGISGALLWLRFLATVLIVLALVVAFFATVGGIFSESLARFSPLAGYGINLAGSLAGVIVFTLLAFLRLPPICWTFLAFLCLVPFFRQRRWALVLFLLTTAITFNPRADTFWSPYYRIDLRPYPIPEGRTQPTAYYLNVNHDFHLNMLDLSNDFLSHYPQLEPYRWAVLNYDLPYRIMPHPSQVLVVGAGSGNDVAAALRHGVDHVDAVEIDPVILRIGKLHHPEHPYDSGHVTIYNDDARAYFKKTHKTYDLIVFGFLDSQTLMSSFSSVRLDNFVYTRESMQEAGRLLRPEGAIVLAFATGRSFVNERMFATLAAAFGTTPKVYENFSNPDISFVIKKGQPAPTIDGLRDVTDYFVQHTTNTAVATDQWPFLYLASRTIPNSILWPLLIFLIAAFYVLQRTVTLPRLASRESMHLFLLGAGFLLLETRGVTELSLLFGSTWIVNAVVIAAFLAMALLANILVMYWSIPRSVSYAVLFALLLLSIVLPYSLFGGLSTPLKVLAAAIVVGLPVFFSGMIFSRSLRDVASPAQALGVNLLGAVVGGTLENIVMVGGTQSLGVLAIALYGVSALLVTRSQTVPDEIAEGEISVQ